MVTPLRTAADCPADRSMKVNVNARPDAAELPDLQANAPVSRMVKESIHVFSTVNPNSVPPEVLPICPNQTTQVLLMVIKWTKSPMLNQPPLLQEMVTVWLPNISLRTKRGKAKLT